MGNTTIKIPAGTLRAIGQAFEPIDSPKARHLRVSIRISDEGISIRDLTAFLELADRLFGRSDKKGFLSYVQRESGHLQISRLTKGSWTLELIELLGSPESYQLIFTALTLKYLPSFAEAYKNIQEGRLAKQQSLLIREQLRQERNLARFDVEKLDDYSDEIDRILQKDRELLHRASRFAERDLLAVEISSDQTDENSSYDA